MEAPDTITCIECGGVCRRVSYPRPDEGFEPGDTIAYVCEDCGRRFDLVFEADED